MSATDLHHASDGTDEGTTDATTDASADVSVDAARDADTTGTPEGSANSATVPAELSKDVLFDILKNERRREALQFLREEPSTTLSDLAEHVAALENGKPIREITSSERKRVYVGFYQCHLPKMADAGVIDYDRSRGTIELREAASPCFVYLDIEPSAEPADAGLADRLCDRLAALTSGLSR